MGISSARTKGQITPGQSILAYIMFNIKRDIDDLVLAHGDKDAQDCYSLTYRYTRDRHGRARDGGLQGYPA